MSWAVNLIGESEAICRALDKYGDALTDMSRVEFDEVRDALKVIVRGNRDTRAKYKWVPRLDASGRGFKTSDANGPFEYNSCSVKIEQIGNLAE
jgi:hypothetical protein